MSRTFFRVVACIAAGTALMILCMVVRFVVVQSPSVFRNVFYLHPLALISWLPVGVVGGWATWLVSRTHLRVLLLASLGGLAVAVTAWCVVQLPSVSAWLLPPATVK